MMHFYPGNSFLKLSDIRKCLSEKAVLSLHDDVRRRIDLCRNYLNNLSNEVPVYGVNTGFGSLCNQMIAAADTGNLQENLMLSHACGSGAEMGEEIVRLMLLLKIQGLCVGNSGVDSRTVQRLIDFYNHDILPVIYAHGSLGASGDLAPLAHLCLPLIGMGEVYHQGRKLPAGVVLQQMGWEPLKLQSKEGLALLNGTQFMSAMACHILLDFENLFEAAHQIAALSFDAFSCRPDPYHPLIHQARPHKGQKLSAALMRQLLQGSAFAQKPKTQVQDPYSFRCIPQVHGASYDTYLHALSVTETEINSATDNPLVFPLEEKILSGGNFHGQALAYILDFMAIAIAELANISERRTYLLISGQRDLPAFLTPGAGLHSGFMIPQYTAASLVSINKQYCTPSSVDSIVSSNGQEDHVSMGANAGIKCLQIMRNAYSVLGIELMNAAQAWDFRKNEQTSPLLKQLFQLYRKHVPFVAEDCVLQPLMQKSEAFIRHYFKQGITADSLHE